MRPSPFLKKITSWRLLPLVLLLGCGGSGPPKKYGSTAETTSPAGTSATAPSPASAAVPALHLRLYLESSASMFPYEATGTDGQFKAALQNLVDNFEGLRANSTQFYTVNDAVYPLKISTSQFIKTSDLFSLTRGVGDSKYTDFEKIFREVLRDLPEGRVSVLVSDLIYSDKFMLPGTGPKNLNAIQSLMQNVFAGAAKNTSLLIVKASAGFKGPYFSISGGKKTYAGDRPYYLCIAARHATMRALLTKPENETLRRFDQLPGYQNQLFFGPDQAPFYTVLLRDPNQKGRMVQESGEMQGNKKAGSTVVRKLDDVEPSPAGRELAVVVGVDLGGYALPEATKTDPASYSVESAENFKVKKVEAVSGLPYTHKLVLSTTEPRTGGQRDVTVGLRRVFPPAWVRSTGVSDDANVNATSFAKTTFGFTNLTQGIENAYNPNQRPEHFRLTISLNN